MMEQEQFHRQREELPSQKRHNINLEYDYDSEVERKAMKKLAKRWRIDTG
jgi:hypothetical protein